MSFILDALKKIEQDKRRADDPAAESIAVSGSRLGARQPLLTMAAIALVSALVTAAAVSLLSGRGDVETSGSPSASEPSIPPVLAEAAPEAETEEAPLASSPAPTPVAREASARVAKPEPEPEEEPEPEPEPEPRREPVVEEPAVADVDDAADADDIGGVVADDMQPIRIVGRERVLLDALSIDDSSEPAGDEAATEAPLPDDFPDLVLQGTSMIGAKAVAVISDQRVFEGDRIEGALVVRIGEREVELELDGHRFTLRL